LFYELCNQAHDSLTLSRPYTKDGSPWPESHLWRAVRALFPDLPIQRLKAGAVVPAREAATPQEAALAAVGGSKGLQAWLAAVYPEYWERIALGRTIERGRISRQPCDQYSGRLRDTALIEWAADFLSPDHIWSATQLGEYGMCGFRFFARRLLRLEALKEPEDGMDIRQLGTLNHEILEATYKALAQADVTITPEYAEQAVETLRQKADALLANAPQRLGFRASPLWEQEKAALLRRLEALVRDDFSGSSPVDKAFPGGVRRPGQFEIGFGFGSPIELSLDDGERIRVSGKIDRVDWQDSRAIVIDYKTGSTKIPTDEIRRGRNFQMMLYLVAAESLLKADEISGAFVHLTDRSISGKMISSSDEDRETIAQAKAHISRNLARGRAGDFAAQASKLEEDRCTKYCDYHQMCRMAIMAKHKREA
jgi:ATP-dependent helicase/DNAse subunit B